MGGFGPIGARKFLVSARFERFAKSWGDAVKLPRRKYLHLSAGVGVLAVCCLFLLNIDASSQPGRTVKAVVPFPAGASTDILARLLGENISKAHGVTVVVENRPGAGASIGYEAVARAAPDGNTVVFAANSLVINPILRKVNYDPKSSFEPICNIVNSPLVLAVNKASPYHTLNDLLDAGRAKPGELSLAGTGPGAAQHIAIERLKQVAKLNMIYVPFAGGAPAVNALLGGHVTAILQNYGDMSEQLKSGSIRPLATASRGRIEPLPSVPTIAESGHRDYEEEVWFGVLAPAKTPDKSISELSDWFSEAIKIQDIKLKLLNIGLYPAAKCGAEFAAHIRNQDDYYRRIVRDANIKSE